MPGTRNIPVVAAIALSLVASSAMAFVPSTGWTAAQSLARPTGAMDPNPIATDWYVAPGGVRPSQGYAGQHWNPEAGLLYAQQRWYDPALGMFLSVDPVQGDLGTPNGLHLWGYANGNPLRYVDPTGESAYQDCLNAANPGFTLEECMAAALKGKSIARPAYQAPTGFVRRTAIGLGNVVAKPLDQHLTVEFGALGYDPDGNPLSAEEQQAWQAEKWNRTVETAKGGLVGALIPAVPLAQGVHATGAGLGTGTAALVAGDYETFGEVGLPAAANAYGLFTGGLGAGRFAVQKGIITGDLALPVTRQTLNPLNWSIKWAAGRSFEGLANSGVRLSGPGVKGLMYKGPSRSYLPQNGTWDGVPGESNFTPSKSSKFPHPDDLDVVDLAPGESIPFKNGRPDFSRWAWDEFDVPGMTGNRAAAGAPEFVRAA